MVYIIVCAEQAVHMNSRLDVFCSIRNVQ